MSTEQVYTMPLETVAGRMSIKPGSHWMTVTSGMSGYFAVEMWLNDQDKVLGVFAEPWTTGNGRYLSREEAFQEAALLAVERGLPLEVLR